MSIDIQMFVMDEYKVTVTMGDFLVNGEDCRVLL